MCSPLIQHYFVCSQQLAKSMVRDLFCLTICQTRCLCQPNMFEIVSNSSCLKINTSVQLEYKGRGILFYQPLLPYWSLLSSHSFLTVLLFQGFNWNLRINAQINSGLYAHCMKACSGNVHEAISMFNNEDHLQYNMQAFWMTM